VAFDYVRRSEWGAAPPKCGPVHVNWPEGVDLWVHHTAGPPSQSVKSIQAFHQGPSRDWCDIGYHWLTEEDGTVFEGRGFEVHGAHCPGHNHEPSISMIGTYSSLHPTDKQHEAVCALMDFLDAGDLRGHREGSSTGTTCPGDMGMADVVNAGCIAVPIGRPRYYFEELPFSQGGHGPVLPWPDGFASKATRDARYLAFKALHPNTPASKHRAGELTKGDVSAKQDPDHGDAPRFYVYTWAPGTHGQRFRFGPWRSEADRDANLRKREQATGRKMRPFNGRQRSLYPWGD
jgi:hypothetical protein